MLIAIRAAALLLIFFLGGIWAAAWFGRADGESVAEAFARQSARLLGGDMPGAPSVGGVQLPQGIALGGPFSLVDHNGRAVTDQDFAGRLSLMYFPATI